MIYTLSPLDGRYHARVAELGTLFSEYGLARYRTIVEIQWLFFLSDKGISPKLDEQTVQKLKKLEAEFNEEDFQAIKDIEAITNHDVKAVELLVRKYIPESHWSWIHFGCTSEDINNTSYALMLKDGREAILETYQTLLDDIKDKAKQWKANPMLSRTHGQTATPTTVGKEFAVFWNRLETVKSALNEVPLTAKFNGATGNYAAHLSAFPNEDWITHSKTFITQYLHLDWNPLTTQIEPHDRPTALLNRMGLASSILIDLSRDIWGYISVGYFGQKTIKGEVGSSTMPHKVNPIDFENGEGNLKLARGIGRTLADELPISRWQRDLTDSTLQRNFGLAFGHFELGMKSILKGLGKLKLNEDRLAEDLANAPEVLTEAVQTVLRAHGHADAYDQLKNFSRGQALNLDQVQAFIQQTNLPKDEKQRLLELTPETYTGLSEKLVDEILGK